MNAPVRTNRVSLAVGLIAVSAAAIDQSVFSGQLLAQVNGAAGSAVVTGRSVDGVTGAPVPGAVVSIARDPADGRRMAGRTVITDAEGRFAFTALPDGRFSLTASRSGWTTGTYQETKPRLPEDRPAYVGPGLVLPDFTLTLRSSERLNLTVPVWRDAVLSGRITTESGEPVGNARVYAQQWTAVMGRRSLTGGLSFTDDRGVFSLRVRPGDYLISAVSDDGRLRGATTTGARFALATTYFPASPDLTGAAVISVKSGEERGGLEIRMPLIPARRITGTLRSTDGAAIPSRISITSREEGGLQRAVAVTNGRFVFDNIPAGQYIVATLSSGVVSSGRGGAASDAWARAGVDVGNTDIDVTVGVHRSLRVSGRVQFDGAASSPTASVTLTPHTEAAGNDVAPPTFPVDSDGRFTVNVTPGRYIVSATARAPLNRATLRPDQSAIAAARPWTLRSALSGGRDVASTPLDVTSDVSDVMVTLTNRSAELRGRVLDLQNTDGVAVLLFPADEALWIDYGIGRRIRQARPAADGTFALADLPAGDYYVSAVRGATSRDWRGGALFDVLAPIAVRLSLEEGMVTSRDLRLATAPTPRSAQSRPRVVPLEAVDMAEVRGVSRPSGGGSIGGRVIDAVTKAPIPGMRLSLVTGLDPSVYSDDDGRFLLTDVPPGQHTIYTFKAGYVSTIYGARRPDEPGTPISVAAGQQVTDIDFPIMKGASITGTVLDQYGLPMPDVEVGVRQYRWQPQGRELAALRMIGRSPPFTNAEGEFRIYGLSPGEYVIDARGGGMASTSPVTLTTQADLDAAAGTGATPAPMTAMYAPVSFPTQAEAARGARLRLAGGEERTVSLQLELVPIARVSGIVRSPDGQPAQRVSVQLVSTDPSLAVGTGSARLGSSDETGTFTISSVLPGRYTLVARPSVTGNQQRAGLTGALDLTVTGNLEGVILNLSPGQVLTGRVRTSGSIGPPTVPSLRVQATRIGEAVTAGAQPAVASWDAEGRFTFVNLLPGRYRLTLIGPRNAEVPAILSEAVEGTDRLNSGIDLKPGASVSVDVLVSGSPLQLSGRLRSASGQPVRNLFVVLFARDAEAWATPAVRVFTTQPDQNSRFTFRDVPPGNYWIAPLTDAEPNEWFDPELLKKLASGAQALTVSPGVFPEIVVSVP
jgi:protocatechuate 3,4-dioxygenase beta subunit